jgi:hypothetical protein
LIIQKEPEMRCQPKFQPILAGLLVMALLSGCAARQPAASPAPAACPPGDLSSIGIMHSTDHGKTWTTLGKACIRGLNSLIAVDPTPLVDGGRIVLYVVDLGHLNQPVPQNIYRLSSVDGVNFDSPNVAFTRPETMVDPFVLRLPDGSTRLYVPLGDQGMVSAVSSDSLTFTLEDTHSLANVFGMPGLLVTPDDKVRFFGSDHPESGGLGSLVSPDGLHFSLESGWRIPIPTGYLYINNPEPIRLRQGGYLMLYQTQDIQHTGRPDWMAEIHLASSEDGYTWVPDPTVITYGGTSCVVEAPDGSLFIYYGTQ